MRMEQQLKIISRYPILWESNMFFFKPEWLLQRHHMVLLSNVVLPNYDLHIWAPLSNILSISFFVDTDPLQVIVDIDHFGNRCFKAFISFIALYNKTFGLYLFSVYSYLNFLVLFISRSCLLLYRICYHFLFAASILSYFFHICNHCLCRSSCRVRNLCYKINLKIPDKSHVQRKSIDSL